MPITMEEIRNGLEVVEQREMTVRENILKLECSLGEIESEKSDLEAAERVCLKLEGTAGSSNKPAKSSSGSTQLEVITLVLGEADAPLSPREIARRAQEEHGRRIPDGTLHGGLHKGKRAGHFINADKRWSIAPQPSTVDDQVAADSGPAQRPEERR